MVEGEDVGGAGGLLHEPGAVVVVLPHDRLVLEEVDVERAERVVRELEAIRLEGAARPALQLPGVVHRELPLVDDQALDPGVTPVDVAARQHTAVAVEGRRHGGGQVVEGARAVAGAGRLGFGEHGEPPVGAAPGA